MKTQTHTCTFMAVGDIMLHGGIAEHIARTADPFYPWHGVKALLSKADVLFGNLETMITMARRAAPGAPDRYYSPPGTGKVLKELGFSVVNIGHNHLYDWGEEGVEATVAEFQDAGVGYAGAGRTGQEASAPVYAKCRVCGRTFGFACFTGTYNTLDRSHAYIGAKPSPQAMETAVTEIRSRAEITVMSIHGGACMNHWPSPDMFSWCRAAADTGADIVLGHHAHVPNGIEVRKRCLIAYALPDFIRPLPLDDSEAVPSMRRNEYESFALTVNVTGDGLAPAYEITPVTLDLACRTMVAAPPRDELIRRRVTELSGDIESGTSTEKHLNTATSDFGNMYAKTLWKAFRKGGLKWVIKRACTAKPYHLTILFKGLLRTSLKILGVRKTPSHAADV